MNDNKLPKFKYTITKFGKVENKEAHLPKWLRFLAIDNDNDGYVDWQQVPPKYREKMKEKGIPLDEHGFSISKTKTTTPHMGSQEQLQTIIPKSMSPDAKKSMIGNIFRIALLILGLWILAQIFLF